MPLTEPLAGTIDLVGPLAERAEELAVLLRGAFRRFGYEPVAPPILERAGPFLDRSGEDIRDRMYIFTDPAGREVCLRPELTIPTARLYVDKCRGENQLLRGFYIGPVFRYDKPREGRYRQFTQVGAEFIGERDEVLADAETLALARHALQSCGIVELDTVVSDVEFFTALLKDSALSPAWGRRLRSLATDPRALVELLEETETIGSAPPEYSGFHAALIAVPESERPGVLRALLGTVSLEGGFGSRDVEDIVRRMIEKAARSGSSPLPAEVAEQLAALLAIDAPLRAGIVELAQLAVKWERPTLALVVAAWERRIALLEAFGVDVDDIRLDLRLRRGIAYYSGFVFEIHSRGSVTPSQLCAGGRYNELVPTLGGRDGTPAVGFALGLERVLLALDHLDPTPLPSRVDAFVVGGGDVADVDIIRVATGLRSDGVAAVLLNGRRVRYALSHAGKQGVRYVVVVGEREAAQRSIKLRDLDAHREAVVSVADAAKFIRGGGELP